MVTFIVLALAQPVIERQQAETPRDQLVLLRDASASVAPEAERVRALAKHFATACGSGRPCSELVFGASVARGENDTIEPDATDIEAAIDAAVAALGAEGGQILLMSDGRATRGDALSAAVRAHGAGVCVHVVPVGLRQVGSPRITRVTPPDSLRLGMSGNALVQVRTDSPTNVVLALLDASGVEVGRTSMSVDGDAVVGLPVYPSRKGPHTWHVALYAGEPTGLVDSAELAFDVAGPPTVLLCDPEPLELEALRDALEPIGFDVTLAAAADFPRDAETLAAYDAIAVSDWEAPQLNAGQVDLVEKYLRAGGGLVFIGGTRVSTKQWHGARFERLLPIDFAPEPVRQVQEPKPAHVCYVLDVSGSMGEYLGRDASGPVTKFEMMKTAVTQSVEALPSTATVSVVVFDAAHSVVLRSTPVTQRDYIREQVRQIGLGGGTNMAPALEEATGLLETSSIARHLILLTDGVSISEPTPQLCQRVRAARVSVTTVAVGADSNTTLLEWLARQTNGVYRYCGDATRIPRVFVNEAKSVRTLAAIQRPPIQPHSEPHSAMLRDFDPNGWPQLDAAIPAVAKPSPGVELILVSERNEALLASWSIGRGRVMAFMGDVKPVWSRRWTQWPEFKRFWGRSISYVVPARECATGRLDVRVEGDRCTVLLALDATEPPVAVGETAAEGSLVPDGGAVHNVSPLRWRRLPSDVFEGTATVEPATRYDGEAIIRGADGSVLLRRTFTIAGQRDFELLETGADPRTLRGLAAAGGGLYAPSPEQLKYEILKTRATTRTVVVHLWRWLVMAALVLWPADVAVRRFGTWSRRGRPAKPDRV